MLKINRETININLFKKYFPRFSLMIDFQGIHARHLQIFREFQYQRQRIVEPITRAQRKIKGIKRLTLDTSEVVREKRVFLPKEMLVQKVNILV